ncbi:MAG: DNA polymerase III subunit alpha, partial [Desulfocapsaceae bacterium]|nr:DNA polymerase III subunit alpha [Desulfocapsaceae bacterium]
MVPLRVRSHFSLLQGTASPAVLCRKAKQYGYRCLALTDVENFYGLWHFLAACRREELRPIVGAEIALDGSSQRTVCLVQNDQGYTNLCNLISRKKGSGVLDIDGLSEHVFDGLILLAGSSHLLRKLRGRGVAVAADLGGRPSARGSGLRDTAAKLGVPAVATPDSDMADRREHLLRRLLKAVETRTLLSPNPGGERAIVANSLEMPDVYGDRFRVWPEVIRATEVLAEQCRFSGPRFGTVMPPWRQVSRLDARELLREQSYGGARRRYGDDLSETVVERLEYELNIIEQMNYSSYFLVVRDIVHPLQPDGSRKLRRICGRGSAAASLVAYCLGITNVCPIRYNLYFERFLNPGRSDPPDIDVDFPWDERDGVLADVLSLFRERAAMVCNHVTFKPRMAIRETARAYGLPGYEISTMTKRLPWFFRRDDESLYDQIVSLPTLQDQDFSEPWPEIITLAAHLVGLPRYISVHPGGVVITPEPVSNYVPVEKSAKGVTVIQWEKDGAEEAGLVKIDLLGNRSLAVIRDAVSGIRKNNSSFSEKKWIPEDDPQTRMTIAEGKTMGCFYIESPAMRLLQKKAGVGDFEQLVIQSSIIRPAANDFVREYVRRLHGGAWTPLHPELEGVLEETFGLMVYQEDVSRVAVHLAGFSHTDADGLRKVLSKKDKELRLRDYRQHFYSCCRNRNIDEDDIERIWAMMMSFNGYSFCKPHSASYARVSFQAAYLKSHYPAEFMAAVISNQGGFYSTFAYVSEAKRMGLAVLAPDVCTSDYRWSGTGKEVRVGLLSIMGLSAETAKRILESRRHRQFVDFSDFFQRVRPAENEMRSLIQAGALDSLDPAGSRSVLLWEAARREQKKQKHGNRLLFSDRPVSPPVLPQQTEIERLRGEYRALGFLCSMHPLCLLRGVHKQAMKASELQYCVGRTVWFSGWLLTGKLVSTKTGEVMEFLTFEDETGLVEA